MSSYYIINCRAEQIFPNISISLEPEEYSDFYEYVPTDFLPLVKGALEKINSKPVGNRLLKKIEKGRHIVEIRHNSTENTCESTNDIFKRELGSGSIVRISKRSKSSIGFDGEKIDNPYFIVLAHELIHAYHNSYGKSKPQSLVYKKIWSNDEEYKTITGYPSKKSHQTKPKISENSIREEHGLSLRYSYHRYDELTLEELEEIKQYAKSHKVLLIFKQIENEVFISSNTYSERSKEEINSNFSKLTKNIFSQISHQLDFDYENSSFNSLSTFPKIRYVSSQAYQKLKEKRLLSLSTEELLPESIQENYLSELVD